MPVRLIDQDELSVGLLVTYTYSKSKSQYGPFIVSAISRDSGGDFVLLRNSQEPQGRRVYLADDEDYGALSFYSNTGK